MLTLILTEGVEDIGVIPVERVARHESESAQRRDCCFLRRAAVFTVCQRLQRLGESIRGRRLCFSLYCHGLYPLRLNQSSGSLPVPRRDARARSSGSVWAAP